MSERTENRECQKCGDYYTLRPECEPTAYCDLCAQTMLDDVIKDNARLKAELDQAQKACAEMRDALLDCSQFPLGENLHYKVCAALDNHNCGKGYVHKAEVEETRIMQLAAISTATCQNTESSIKDRITRDNSYWTQAYQDTCVAVDREMRHRGHVEQLKEAFPFPEVTRGNLEGIRFHCKNGKPFGGLTQDALCEWLDGLSIQLQKYIDAKSALDTKKAR